MGHQLKDPAYRSAIKALARARPDLVLAGTVGAQLHLADQLGDDKLGPPAKAIDVVAPEGATVPESVDGLLVRRIDTLGFDGSIAAKKTFIALDGTPVPVACPEHVLGTMLGQATLGTEGRYAAFALMRAMEARGLDLEEVRGFLKRCRDDGREELLRELAYLAA